MAGPTTTKACGPSSPSSPPARALQPLPQCQGTHPPLSAWGEPKTTDTSSQWYVSGPRYDNSNFLKCLQNRGKIFLLFYDRKSKVFKSCSANPYNMLPITRQTKIAVGTKNKTVKFALINICSLKNKFILVNNLTTNNLDLMFLN